MAEEKNKDRPALCSLDTGAERRIDLDRHGGSAVAYGMVDRGRLLRYGPDQPRHGHRSDRHLTASRLARGAGAKETLQGRDDQTGKSTRQEKRRASIAIFSLISLHPINPPGSRSSGNQVDLSCLFHKKLDLKGRLRYSGYISFGLKRGTGNDPIFSRSYNSKNYTVLFPTLYFLLSSFAHSSLAALPS